MTTTDELAANLKRALSSALDGTLEQLRGILISYAEQGVSRQCAYSVLAELRVDAANESVEDRILELMDLVSGYCSPHAAIPFTD